MDKFLILNIGYVDMLIYFFFKKKLQISSTGDVNFIANICVVALLSEVQSICYKHFSYIFNFSVHISYI